MQIANAAAKPLALAVSFLKAGRPAEAIPLLREASRLQPFDPTILHDLGLACLEAGDPHEAAAAFEGAVAANPRYADAYFRLGIALEKLGRVTAAIVAYDRATELLPSLTEAWFRVGALVYTLGHVEEAAGCFRRAAATGPKTGFGRLGAARALLAEGRDPEAETVLRRLLAVDAKNAIGLDLLGNLLADSGRFEEAREALAAAIAASPLMAGSYYDFVRCRRVTEADGDLVSRMQAALATPGMEPAQKQRVHLAIGKAADDIGDYALAMRHFDAADAIRRATTPFDAAAFSAQVDVMIARFTPEIIARAQSLGSPDPTPILIVGMPRSGTTLVEQILSSHRQVAAAGELNFWNERGAAAHLAGSKGLDAAFLAQAASDYLALLRKIAPKAARVTDKMPFNFLWVGLIHLACPQARIIHVKRSAIDTALSIHQTQFNPNVPFPTGGPELVAYFEAVQRLTAHWDLVLPAERFLTLDYESLTTSPEQEIRRLVAFCRLDWDDACLYPERNPRVVRTPSKWQARQAINRSAVERWRRYEPFLGALAALQTTGSES